MFEILLVAIVVIGFGLILWQLRKNQTPQSQESLTLLNQNLQGLHERVDKTTDSMNQRLDNAANVIASVHKELGHVQEMGRAMLDFQQFLKSPKLRGNIGEHVLRDLLEQAFSRDHFAIQYKFKDGQMVDAIIKTDRGILPIDAKFPLENFQKFSLCETDAERDGYRKLFIQDVKKHIADISKKYILPGEGTLDFAMMYIPSETIYYEMIRQDEDLNLYATNRKVFPVSPNSFYYFLKVIMMGLEGQRIEEAAEKIMQLLGSLNKDRERVSESLGILNTHLTNARGALERVNSDYEKMGSRVDQMKLLK